MTRAAELRQALRIAEGVAEGPAANARVAFVARFANEARNRLKKYLGHKDAADAMFGQVGLSSISRLLSAYIANPPGEKQDRAIYWIVGEINEILVALGDQKIQA